ncbi:complex III assembly factor LYRM7 [Diabrotica virgifera virgifera]|uniref:Complex III assembly factor LYRM7 n=1 Tax=Diabrotica virgifera virgifera TaxID=50390 RepID=A0A6P7FNZ3_DIAVI|nr:complex III assembly factor LYRM7 [Diabrotica virgifera virgifera]
MSGPLRARVLQSFKNIHKTRKNIFDGDIIALTEARNKINEEYKKCKHVSDPGAIEELVKYSEEVEKELRTTVIQAKEVKPGVFEAKIRDETVKLENVPFNECASKQNN